MRLCSCTERWFGPSSGKVKEQGAWRGLAAVILTHAYVGIEQCCGHGGLSRFRLSHSVLAWLYAMRWR